MVQYSCSTQQNENERIDIRGLRTATSTSTSPIPVSPASRMKTAVGSSSPTKKSTMKSTTGSSSTTTRRTRPTTTNKNNHNNVTFSPLGRNNMPVVKSKSTPTSGNHVDPNQQPDFRKVKPCSLKEKTRRSVSMPSSKKKKGATTVNGSYSNAHSPNIKESVTNHHSRMSSTTGNNTGRSSSRSFTPTTKHHRRPSYNNGSTTTTTSSCYSNTHDRNHCQTSTDRPFHHHSPKAHKPRVGIRQQQQRKHTE